MRRLLLLIWMACVAGTAHASAPNHVASIPFFIHADVASQLDAEELRQYLEESRVLFQGTQYADDSPCCTQIEDFEVTIFGEPGDGQDVIDTVEAFDRIRFDAPPGAYIVQSLMVCTSNGVSSPTGSALFGCAPRGEDTMFVTLDTPVGTRPKVISHERGHSVGLGHSADGRRLMSQGISNPSAPKGLVVDFECQAYLDRAEPAGQCECIVSEEFRYTPAALGTGCGEERVCGGDGLCYDFDELYDPPASEGVFFWSEVDADYPFRSIIYRSDQHDETSNRTFVTYAGGRIPSLTYSKQRDLLYGISTGDGVNDHLLSIRPDGTSVGGKGEVHHPGIRGLAYDPDFDILWGTDGFNLLRIDPDDASVRDFGPIQCCGSAEALFFDSNSGRLFMLQSNPHPDIRSNVFRVFPLTGTTEAFPSVTFVDPRGVTFDPVEDRFVVLGETGFGMAELHSYSIDGIRDFEARPVTFPLRPALETGLALIPGPEDQDGDGVPDSEDNCVLVANPRLGTEGEPGRLPFQTTTGGQLDDDADGFGNACDAKFVAAGAFVGGADLAEIQASFNRDRAGSDCGTTGDRPCAMFDLDNRGDFIGAPDLSRSRQRFNALPGPNCGPFCDALLHGCEGPACP